jgi:hypothetical protein
MRWWDGAQWTSMVSDNGATLDENAPLQPGQPTMQQPMMQQPMGMPGMTPVAPATPPKRNNALIAIIAVVVLAAAGVGVYLLTKDDKGSDKVSSGTATTTVSTATTGSGGTTQPTTVVTGSGGRDSQTPEGQAYVDAMMLSSGESGFSEADARCVAEGAVDIVGVQALKDAGVTPDMVASGSELLPDFTPTEAQANAMIDMMFGCVDFGQMMVGQMGVQLPADQVQCIGDALETNETFRTFMVTTMISSTSTTVDTTDIQTSLTTAMLEIFTSCGVDPGSLAG